MVFVGGVEPRKFGNINRVQSQEGWGRWDSQE